MNIYSKHSDYFDGVAGQFRDPSIHWARKETDLYVSISNLPKGITKNIGKLSSTIQDGKLVRDIEILVVGVCGKFYPVARCAYTDEKSQCQVNYLYKDSAITKVNSSYCDKNWWEKRRKKNIIDSLDIINALPQDDSLFIRYGSPVLIFRREGVLSWYRADKQAEAIITVDPLLKDVQFYKVMDAWTIMQELSMYFSGPLTQRDPPKEFGDKIKIQQHGFDVKSSFRKAPTKTR